VRGLVTWDKCWWKWFERHCIQTDPILVEMCKPGILIDAEAQKEFKGTLVADRDKSLAKLNQEVPVGVKKVKIWKRQPKDMTGVTEFVGPLNRRYMEAVKQAELLGKKPKAPGKLTVMVYACNVLVETAWPQAVSGWYERRWRKTLPFNPESHVQVKSLIRALNLPMPRNKREKKDTTGAKHLKVLARKSSIFQTILECREKGTMTFGFLAAINSSR